MSQANVLLIRPNVSLAGVAGGDVKGLISHEKPSSVEHERLKKVIHLVVVETFVFEQKWCTWPTDYF